MRKMTPLGWFICGFFMLSPILGKAQSTQEYEGKSEILTLERALEIAYENSPTLRQSKISLEQSQNSLISQRASLKSQFSLDLNPFSYSRNSSFQELNSEWNTFRSLSSSGTFTIRQPIKWTDGTISLNENFGWQDEANQTLNRTSTSFFNRLTLSLEQPIFTYNRTKLELRRLELALERSKLNYAMQQLNIEKTVTQAFYQVYQSYKNLLTAREELKNQQQNYEVIKDKVEHNLVAKEELFQAEVNLANSESSLYDQETSYENTKDQFKQTLGLPLDMDISVLPNTEVVPVEVDLNQAVQHALKQRMELRNMEIQIEEGTFSLIEAKATNEFKGSISAQVGLFSTGSNFSGAFRNPDDNQDVGISLTIPIWDWGVRKATIRNAELSNESTEIDFEEEKKTIVIEVRQLCRNLPKLVKQIEINRQKIKNAEMTYEINLENYRNGTITGMDLQQYQTQLSSAKTEYTNSLIQYKIELLNLKIQTLWDYQTNTSYLPVDLLK